MIYEKPERDDAEPTLTPNGASTSRRTARTVRRLTLALTVSMGALGAVACANNEEMPAQDPSTVAANSPTRAPVDEEPTRAPHRATTPNDVDPNSNAMSPTGTPPPFDLAPRTAPDTTTATNGNRSDAGADGGKRTNTMTALTPPAPAAAPAATPAARTANAQPSSGVRGDDATPGATNTRINGRDANGATLTPMDQGGSEADRTITQRIRKALMADSALSFNAKNAKVVTIDGAVTLRGPVKSGNERSKIETAAKNVAGVTRVDNQLEIAP